jgi:hypothetical protein
MVALRLVKPVTTANGKLAGIAGVGVGVGASVAPSDSGEVGDGDPATVPPGEGTGVGLAPPHAARSATTASAVTLRNMDRLCMSLS